MAKSKPKTPAKTDPDTDRITEVLRIRLDGAQLHDVVDYFAEKKQTITETEAEDLIRQADDLLVQRRDRKRSRVITRHIAQRETLYARAVNAADYRTAASILNDIARLQGLYDRHKDRGDMLRLIAAQHTRIQQLEARLSIRAIEVESSTNAQEEETGKVERKENACRPGTG
jgi:hypothetical protein